MPHRKRQLSARGLSEDRPGSCDRRPRSTRGRGHCPPISRLCTRQSPAASVSAYGCSGVSIVATRWRRACAGARRRGPRTRLFSAKCIQPRRTGMACAMVFDNDCPRPRRNRAFRFPLNRFTDCADTFRRGLPMVGHGVSQKTSVPRSVNRALALLTLSFNRWFKNRISNASTRSPARRRSPDRKSASAYENQASFTALHVRPFV